jgi:hypothetical protein
VAYTLDWSGPIVLVSSPLDNELKRSTTVTVEGTVEDGETAGIARRPPNSTQPSPSAP